MKKRNRKWTVSIWTLFLLLLILDTDTAKTSASDGIEMCLKVIIPSLFPFFFVTFYLNVALLGISIPGFSQIARWVYFPAGGDSLLLLGIIGGYPVGAQLVAEACRKGNLRKDAGKILLGYCNNAGPAFIFGVTGMLFSSLKITIVLWLIHIFSSLLTGRLLPRPQQNNMASVMTQNTTLIDTLKKSMYSCATVCGWIIICKIITGYFDKWLSGVIAAPFTVLLSGFLELSNGCLMLDKFPSESSRFILSSLFLAFGGFCVMLQTASVTKDIGLGLYIPGKIIQAAVSTLTAAFVSHILFHGTAWHLLIYLSVCVPVIILVKMYAENKCGNPNKNAV